MVLARKLASVVEVAVGAGVSREDLLDSVGLTDADLADPERWLEQSVWRDLWLEVVRRTDNTAIGLEAGARAGGGYFGVLDYVVCSSETLGQAIEATTRYFRLANTYGEIEVGREGELLRVVRRISGDESGMLPPQVAEFSLAAMVSRFRSASATSWSLARADFRHKAPPHESDLRAYFACPVRFEAADDALLVDPAVLDVATRAPDPQLRRLVESHANALIERLPRNDDLPTRVRRKLLADLAGTAPTADTIASALGMSRRSLHRGLKDHDTSFKRLLEAVRFELAKAHLSAETSLGEIAFLLGFAELSSFHRAFRNWAGMPPGEFRAAAQSTAQLR